MAQKLDNPNVNVVLLELMSLQDAWKEIGTNLGLENSELKEVEEEGLSPLDSLGEVLAIAQEKEPLTWSKIAAAVLNKKIEEACKKRRDLVNEMKQKYGKL